jgi:hypothetical protein
MIYNNTAFVFSWINNRKVTGKPFEDLQETF